MQVWILWHGWTNKLYGVYSTSLEFEAAMWELHEAGVKDVREMTLYINETYADGSPKL
jgi:hypothetical protein